MQARAYGKWILAGEHAVIRGCPALVFPLFAKSLLLKYQSSDKPASVTSSGETGQEFELLFRGVLQKGLELVGKTGQEIRGQFQLESSVPLGAGLGASATFCVALGQWFVAQNWLAADELYEFSRKLEDLFHGESSGVDVAVAISGQGLHFVRNGERRAFVPAWKPLWFLSHTGRRGITSECVARVKALWESDRAFAEKIDQDMKSAVLLAEKALLKEDNDSFAELAQAIELAGSCFSRWRLADGEVHTHLQSLKEAGATAVKPTGSGDGGYALSLWKTPPSEALSSKLIALS